MENKIVLSPSLTFPNIYWWSVAEQIQTAIIDTEELFQKMTFRNSYFISSANGLLQLSIPIEQGRQQKCSMKNIKIFNQEKWQQKHFKSIVSAYNRSPFFEYYRTDFEQLFSKQFIYLIDFNREATELLISILKSKITIKENYDIDYNSNNIIDCRNQFKKSNYLETLPNHKQYYQVFESKNSFLPNLSVLDLLFNEGNAWQSYLATDLSNPLLSK